MPVATPAARLALPAALLLAVLAGPAAAQTSVTVNPLPDHGIPPTLEQYPLRDRLFGPGGAVFPGYVAPPDINDRERLSYVIGGSQGNMVFAAATVDRLCQWNQVPEVEVIRPPAGGSIKVDTGHFTARSIDAGTTFCVGRDVRGARVHYVGRPPAGGTSVTLRVFYPIPGRSYDHVVSIPAP